MTLATLEPKFTALQSNALRPRPRLAWAWFGFRLLRGIRRRPSMDIPQPEWARVSRRAWRRHSALLTCLHEERKEGVR